MNVGERLIAAAARSPDIEAWISRPASGRPKDRPRSSPSWGREVTPMLDRACYVLADMRIRLVLAGALTFGMTFVSLALGVR